MRFSSQPTPAKLPSHRLGAERLHIGSQEHDGVETNSLAGHCGLPLGSGHWQLSTDGIKWQGSDMCRRPAATILESLWSNSRTRACMHFAALPTPRGHTLRAPAGWILSLSPGAWASSSSPGRESHPPTNPQRCSPSLHLYKTRASAPSRSSLSLIPTHTLLISPRYHFLSLFFVTPSAAPTQELDL